MKKLSHEIQNWWEKHKLDDKTAMLEEADVSQAHKYLQLGYTIRGDIIHKSAHAIVGRVNVGWSDPK